MKIFEIVSVIVFASIGLLFELFGYESKYMCQKGQLSYFLALYE
jgi:hypothetical protein